MFASYFALGHQLLFPIPDLDRTDFFLAFGANPLASNGSIMTAGDVRGRLRAIRDRGGRVVYVDPRRTESAKSADEHVFIRPGTDAWVLLAMLHVIFAEGLVKLGKMTPHVERLDVLEAVTKAFPPERAERVSGVPADTTGSGVRGASRGMICATDTPSTRVVISPARMASLRGSTRRPRRWRSESVGRPVYGELTAPHAFGQPLGEGGRRLLAVGCDHFDERGEDGGLRDAVDVQPVEPGLRKGFGDVAHRRMALVFGLGRPEGRLWRKMHRRVHCGTVDRSCPMK